MSRFRSRVMAGSAVVAAVAVGCAVGQLDLGHPQQLLRPPYIEQVPGGLLAAFVLLAVAGVGVSVLLSSGLVRRRGWGIPAFAVLALMGATASVWGGLYLTAILTPIPVLDWAFYAAPVALAGLLAGRVGADSLALGLLAAVPVAATNTLGWAISGGASLALVMAVFSGGFGLVIGLGVGAVLANVTRLPAQS